MRTDQVYSRIPYRSRTQRIDWLSSGHTFTDEINGAKDKNFFENLASRRKVGPACEISTYTKEDKHNEYPTSPCLVSLITGATSFLTTTIMELVILSSPPRSVVRGGCTPPPYNQQRVIMSSSSPGLPSPSTFFSRKVSSALRIGSRAAQV